VLKKENIKRGPITTILGVLLILTGIFLLVYPIIKDIEYILSPSILSILLLFGAGLIISPDNLLVIMRDKAKKIIE